MRITSALTRRRSLGYSEYQPVPFREILPLQLKAGVSGKGSRLSDVCCIYEMSLMFACFQQTEFAENGCAKEIDNFKNCYVNHMHHKKMKEEREAKGLLAPGEKFLSAKQVNILLSRYPNLK